MMAEENFEHLFEESIKGNTVETGKLIKGTVIEIKPNKYVVVDLGLKADSAIPVEQFQDQSVLDELNPGDELDVVLEYAENGHGIPIVSYQKAKVAESWQYLLENHEAGKRVKGIVSGKIKGGFAVDIGYVRAFLPGSLVDLKSTREMFDLEGKELDFKIIKVDPKRNNVVVSRRAMNDTGSSRDRQALLDNLQEGQVIKGVVKNLTEYGAFIDLGGVDGLLHIIDMAWKRVKDPSEIVSVGTEITVKVLKFDREKERVSLGLKQLGEDPWADLPGRYPMNAVLKGRVTNITDYGCFVELEEGVEGLVHVSEMDWTNKNIHPSKVVQLGNEVSVKVLGVDSERRRISLGIKQCLDNPWATFFEKHQKDERISGVIKSITDFGIFIGLEGNIDGLVHLSDISWESSGEEAIQAFKKGQEIETIILSIDPERERISLGIKQLQEDPLAGYLEIHPKGSIVSGEVIETTAKNAIIQLEDEIKAYLRVSEIRQERVEDLRDEINVGDTIEAKIINLDRKNRMLNISIKAKDDDSISVETNNEPEDLASPTLGDIMKDQIDLGSRAED